jgi:hypothetical protein
LAEYQAAAVSLVPLGIPAADFFSALEASVFPLSTSVSSRYRGRISITASVPVIPYSPQEAS